MLAYVTADSLWEGGRTNTETNRPVWMMLAGTDNELRPFVANIQGGRKAETVKNHGKTREGDRFEILKSSKFQTAWQRTPVGSTVTLFLPELFRLDPGMVDPSGVSFCILPSRSWLTSIEVLESTRDHALSLELPNIEGQDLEHYCQLAPLFIAYLDRRTRCPLVPDPRFWVQLLLNSIEQGYATVSTSKSRYSYSMSRPNLLYREFDTTEIGLASGLAFQVSHQTLEHFLAEQVKFFFDQVKDS